MILKKTRLPLWAFFILTYVASLFVRLLFFYTVLENGKHSFYTYDSEQYFAIAKSLTAGNGFFESIHNFYAYRLPGYSIFLATIIKLLSDSVSVILHTQIVILSSIPLLFYTLSKQLFPGEENLARWLSIGTIFWYPMIVYSGFILTEGIFCLFLLMFFITYLRSKQSNIYIITAGLLLGILSLIRPIGIPLLILTSSFFIILHWKTSTIKLIKTQLLFLISFIVVIAPWLLRNYFMFGAIFFHTLPGKHFLQYSAGNVYQAAKNLSYQETRNLLFDKAEKEKSILESKLGYKLNEYQECLLLEKTAFEVFKQHPIHLFKDCCSNWAKTLLALHSSPIIFSYEEWPSTWTEVSILEKIRFYLIPSFKNSWLNRIILYDLLNLIILWGLILASCIAVIRKLLDPWIFLFGLLFSGLFVFLTLSYGCARLRFPIESIILIIGCYSTKLLIRKNYQKKDFE